MSGTVLALPMHSSCKILLQHFWSCNPDQRVHTTIRDILECRWWDGDSRANVSRGRDAACGTSRLLHMAPRACCTWQPMPVGAHLHQPRLALTHHECVWYEDRYMNVSWSAISTRLTRCMRSRQLGCSLSCSPQNTHGAQFKPLGCIKAAARQHAHIILF